MALLANYPFALAPGMGLNAYMAGTVCANMGYSWKVALLAVFAEGLVFIVLSLTNVREAIFNAIPFRTQKRSKCRYRIIYRIYRSSGSKDCSSRQFNTSYLCKIYKRFSYSRNRCIACTYRIIYNSYSLCKEC